MGKLDKLSDLDKQSIVNQYANGDSLKVIAQKLSCTAPTVAVFLRKNGQAIRGKGKKVAPVQEAVENVLDNDGTEDELDNSSFDDRDDEESLEFNNVNEGADNEV